MDPSKLFEIAKGITQFLSRKDIQGLSGTLLRTALGEAITRGEVVSDDELAALASYAKMTKDFEEHG